MSSPAYGEPLELNIRPSRQVASLVLAIHLTAAAVTAQLPLNMLSHSIILMAVLVSLVWNGVMFWRRTPRRLMWSRELGWRITGRNGMTQNMELLPRAYIGSWLHPCYQHLVRVGPARPKRNCWLGAMHALGS